MVKRMFFMLVAVGGFLAIIGFFKYRQIQAAIAQGSSFQPPPEAVTTVVAKEEAWRPDLGAIGTVEAVRGVVLSADLSGIVDKIHFESGQKVRAGDVLLDLDARQERAQLASAEAQRDLDRSNHERAKMLIGEKVISQADADAASAAFDRSEALVGELRATIDRKSIRAPFAGVLGIRQVNLGQYLKSGDPVVPLQAVDPVYVNFSVPQQEFSRVRPGGAIAVTADDPSAPARVGKITAINAVVDEATRNVQVQATLANGDGALRPGMFVRAQVQLDATQSVVPLPSSAISFAPFGDSVFIVEDVKGPDGKSYRGVRQQFVKLGPSRGDQVAVLSGVKPGEEIVSAGTFKLRNGGAVQVTNKVQPSNEAAPKPQDN
jgi:membrane fusion protein (multidrug efflux system)